MKQPTQRHEIGKLFALLTFAVFAVCVLLVLLTGADSYRKLTERDAKSWSKRTCIQYVATRVRHADSSDGIYVGDFSGTPAEFGSTLFLTESIDGAEYCTRIYCHNGQLLELFSGAEETFLPEDGTPVLDAQAVEFRLSDDLLTIHTTDTYGELSTLHLTLRSGGEAET